MGEDQLPPGVLARIRVVDDEEPAVPELEKPATVDDDKSPGDAPTPRGMTQED